jgi:hypothetical protein
LAGKTGAGKVEMPTTGEGSCRGGVSAIGRGFLRGHISPAARKAEALNGVIVMKNRVVFKWITWMSGAIAFSNFREGNSYVIDRE